MLLYSVFAVILHAILWGGGGLSQREYVEGNTVEALVSDHLGNSEKWSQLELVAYENGLL